MMPPQNRHFVRCDDRLPGHVIIDRASNLVGHMTASDALDLAAWLAHEAFEADPRCDFAELKVRVERLAVDG